MSVAEHGSDSKYQKLCSMAHAEYNGRNPCAYNVARAFTDAKRFLEENVSMKSRDWAWGRVHVATWTHLPFSKTPLKFLYHREVPSGGNDNTVNISQFFKSKNYDKTIMSSTEGPNLK